jgi:hypothetical protein
MVDKLEKSAIKLPKANGKKLARNGKQVAHEIKKSLTPRG